MINEITIAYQANIPVVIIKNTGGWSDKLAEQYLDERKRIRIKATRNPKEAVELAIKLAKKHRR